MRAVGFGHPDDETVLAQHPGQPGAARPGVTASARPGPSRWVSHWIVPRTSTALRLAGLVAGQPADVIRGRDQPRCPARDGGGQLDRQPPRAVCVQAVQQPQVAPAHVDDPLAVGARLPGVRPVVVGVPPQVAAGQVDRVDVPGALVVGQEREPVPDQHRAGEVPGQVRRRSGGTAVPRRPAPAVRSQSRPAVAAVALAPGRVAGPAGQHRGGGGLDGDLGHDTERQLAEPGAAGSALTACARCQKLNGCAAAVTAST